MTKAPFLIAALAFGCSALGAGDELEARSSAASSGPPRAEPSEPAYTESGELLRRDDWPEWVFLGAALNLAYTEQAAPTDLFTNVFMEPAAFQHFRDTGELADGTLTALVVYAAASGAAPAFRGQFAGVEVAFEMSVKDSVLDAAQPWRYYSFPDAAASAAANAPELCFDCHAQHAATDHVFTQFYPVMQRGR